MESKLADTIEFADNPEPRCACVLLLDTSSSMIGAKIAELNAGLQTFKTSIVQDEVASKRVELAIVKFDSSVDVVQDFVTVDQLNPPTLQASGVTSMGAGLNRALDMLRARKDIYRSNGVVYYRPWLFMVTDGEPTDDVTGAASRLKVASDKKEVAFFAVGVDGADMACLNRIAAGNQPVRLRGLDFASMFLWLSASLQRVSQSRPGEQTALTPPTQWTV